MRPKMDRVCFVCPPAYGYFNEDAGLTGGGAERQIYLLSNYLKKTFDLHVVVGDFGQPKVQSINGVTLHRAYSLNTDYTGKQFASVTKLACAMSRADADIYIFRGLPYAVPAIHYITRCLGTKWIYNVANDANIKERPKDLSKIHSYAFINSVSNADLVITQTDYQKELVEKNINTKRIAVVPNGYPEKSNIPSYDDREYFLWVGTLDEKKQPEIFLQLANLLPEKQFRLVGPLDENVERHRNIIEEAGLLENVHLTGEVPPSKIEGEYADAIALINTSKYEGFPNTFLESWRSKTPVISLNVPLERFINSNKGYTSGNLDSLTALTSSIADNKSQWEDLANYQYEYFSSKLTINRTGEMYGDAIRAILS